MAARRNDAALATRARSLKATGLTSYAVAKLLGICHTTVMWYVNHPDDTPLYACPYCGCRASEPTGHASCAA